MSSIAYLKQRNERLHVETSVKLDELRDNILIAVQNQERAVKALEEARRTQVDAYVQALASYESALMNLSSRLESLIDKGSQVWSFQRILENLTFPERPRRHDAKAEAYRQTFDWIFKDEITTFKTWLASESGIFWVNGKAGSGKSTLMKFLCDHPRTGEVLEQWARADSRKIVSASFYFWNAGHPIERTHEGLLRSLLFQMLRKCPHVMATIFPERMSADELSHRFADSWTRADLSSALTKIIELGESDLPTKFCFFIDGLDECEGDRHQLVIDLKALSCSNLVKLCVSSRPWTEFKDAFGENKNKLLVLQDLTKGDMDRFVRGMLGEDDRFVRMAKQEPAFERIVEEILRKAQGVFLWVFLVVRSLRRGLDHHNDIAFFEARLNELPPTLEKYFARILDRIASVYQDHAARMFQLMSCAAPLPLTAFWYMPREIRDPDYVLSKSDMAPINDNEAEE